MTGKAARVNCNNSQTVFLDLGNDFTDARNHDLEGNHEGVIDGVERVDEENGISFRIWVKITVENDIYRLTRFLPTPRSFKEELTQFGVDLEAIDVSDGLDCSPIVGRKVAAVVSSKPTKDGKTWNWITELNPI